MPLCIAGGSGYCARSGDGDDEAAVGRIAGAIVLCALWATLIVVVALQEAPLATRGDARALMLAAREHVKDAGVANCALALIEGGCIFDSCVYRRSDALIRLLARSLSSHPNLANQRREALDIIADDAYGAARDAMLSPGQP